MGWVSTARMAVSGAMITDGGGLLAHDASRQAKEDDGEEFHFYSASSSASMSSAHTA